MHKRLQVVIRDALGIHEGADRLLGRQIRQFLDLLWCAAEPGPAKQMLGAVVAPVRGGESGSSPPSRQPALATSPSRWPKRRDR